MSVFTGSLAIPNWISTPRRIKMGGVVDGETAALRIALLPDRRLEKLRRVKLNEVISRK